jgi:hypothetical protein
MSNNEHTGPKISPVKKTEVGSWRQSPFYSWLFMLAVSSRHLWSGLFGPPLKPLDTARFGLFSAGDVPDME